MTGAQKQEHLENAQKSLKALEESEESLKVSLDALLKLDPAYQFKDAHENSIQQVTARREEMVKLVKQIQDMETQG